MHFCKAYLVWDFKVGVSCGTVWLGLKHSQETVNQTDKNQTHYVDRSDFHLLRYNIQSDHSTSMSRSSQILSMGQMKKWFGVVFYGNQECYPSDRHLYITIYFGSCLLTPLAGSY